MASGTPRTFFKGLEVASNYAPHALALSAGQSGVCDGGRPGEPGALLRARHRRSGDVKRTKQTGSVPALDASRVIPEKANEYHRRGQQLLDELGAVVPAAERIDV